MAIKMSATILNRVPHVITLYWVIKIAATTLGETGADMVSMTFNLGYGFSIILFALLFSVLLAIKISIKKYEPILYWLLFTASAIVGTEISDFIDRTLGLGYALGSLILIFFLFATLLFWFKKEGSINVEVITTSRAEMFYWIAFLIANTLGTAAGDFLADNLHLGFTYSALLISVILLVLVMVHLLTKKWATLLFWIAFVLTRPFGATFGDLLTKPAAKGGLAIGTIASSLFFAVVLVLAVYQEVRLEKLRGR